MKRTKTLLLSLLLVLALLLGGCGDSTTAQHEDSDNLNQSNIVTNIETGDKNDNESISDEAEEEPADPVIAETDDNEPGNNNQNYQNIENISSENNSSESSQQEATKAFALADVPAYNGKAYVAINNNEPYFTQADYTVQSFERYSALDSLGRCGAAFANVGLDIMPTEDRGDISSVTPSGWKNKIYGELVDGGYLYNRCHLLGFQLTGENANEKNLITGTRYMNIEGMLPFENMVADYVKETNNHVLYRVTPIFEGSNLLANGVLMEGYSIEDEGEGISFCVYCYNVQPNIVLDYSTGESYAEGADEPTNTTPTPQPTPKPAPTPAETTPSPAPAEPAPAPSTPAEPPAQTADYILNTNSHKFHYPDCSSVKSMKESNKEYFSGSREEIINRGYEPCKRCEP